MTPERKSRFKEVIARRQHNLTVILEDVTDPHNVAAVLRSCDAVGVSEVHIIQTYEPYGRHYGKDILKSRASSSARKWLEIHKYESVEACVEAVRPRFANILATHLATDAKSLYELELTGSVALVFGNEHSGVSQSMLSNCDGNFIIPQMGMISSLNISVACAVSLYEALRQRTHAGAYEGDQMPASRQEALYDKWAQRERDRKKQPPAND